MKLPRADAEGDGPNLTPVIDVVFLLLIFFLVATRLDEEEREIQTKLPVVVQARAVSGGHKQIIVNVSDQGEYKIAGKKFSLEQIEGLLQEEVAKNPNMQAVQVRADERVVFKHVARLLGVCERQKVKHSIMVQQAQP